MLSLIDRIPPSRIFGRTRDLTFLDARASARGLTVVTGRAQIGKSRLLKELQACLTARGSLVGLAESSGETPDLMLRSVQAMYSRWTQDATFRNQAELLLSQYKERLSPPALRLFGQLVQVAGTVTFGSAFPARTIDDIFLSLFSLDTTLRTPIAVPRLTYDQVYELVSTVYESRGTPIALILDGLEQSPLPKLELSVVQTFLRRMEDWPEVFHVFLGIREPNESEESTQIIQALGASSPAVVVHELAPMRYDVTTNEPDDLFQFARQWIPAVRQLSQAEFLNLLDGYPGTLARWLYEKPKDIQNLQRLARDAQAYRYHELDAALVRICRQAANQRAVSARLAMFPEITSFDAWDKHRQVLIDSLPEEAIQELQSARVLDPSVAFPSWGHTTRYRAARDWFLKSPVGIPFARHETALLVRRLVRSAELPRPDQFKWIDESSSAPFAPRAATASVAYLLDAAVRLGIDTKLIALATAADSILARKAPSEQLFDELRSAALADPDLAVFASEACELLLEGLSSELVAESSGLEVLEALSEYCSHQQRIAQAAARATVSALDRDSTMSTFNVDRLTGTLHAIVARTPSPVAIALLAQGLRYAVQHLGHCEKTQTHLNTLRSLSQQGEVARHVQVSLAQSISLLMPGASQADRSKLAAELLTLADSENASHQYYHVDLGRLSPMGVSGLAISALAAQATFLVLQDTPPDEWVAYLQRLRDLAQRELEGLFHEKLCGHVYSDALLGCIRRTDGYRSRLLRELRRWEGAHRYAEAVSETLMTTRRDSHRRWCVYELVRLAKGRRFLAAIARVSLDRHVEQLPFYYRTWVDPSLWPTEHLETLLGRSLLHLARLEPCDRKTQRQVLRILGFVEPTQSRELSVFREAMAVSFSRELVQAMEPEDHVHLANRLFGLAGYPDDGRTRRLVVEELLKLKTDRAAIDSVDRQLARIRARFPKDSIDDIAG